MKINAASITVLCALFLGVFGVLPAHAEINTPHALKSLYDQANGRKIRVLLVPGHDEEYWGTEFRKVREETLTRALANDLYKILSQDPRFEVFITRTTGTYTPLFSDYFASNEQGIQAFISNSRQAFTAQIETGQLKLIEGVPHNNANSTVAYRLFGINKWINENNIDLALHIHFNDAPGRPANSPGRYRGFAVYVPEHQYANSAISNAFGEAMYMQLGKYYSQSVLPKENTGVVQEQELIAIGPGDSLKSAVMLVEYGYIYEPQFLDETIRGHVIKDLAYQSYLGLHKFFGDDSTSKSKYGTPLLPHAWKTSVEVGELFSEDVLRLQAALRYLGLFPAIGKEDYDCRMTGTFGPCTVAGLAAFQKLYKIPGGDGTVIGPKTRAKLNAVFGS